MLAINENKAIFALLELENLVLVHEVDILLVVDKSSGSGVLPEECLLNSTFLTVFETMDVDDGFYFRFRLSGDKLKEILTVDYEIIGRLLKTQLPHYKVIGVRWIDLDNPYSLVDSILACDLLYCLVLNQSHRFLTDNDD